MQPLTFAGKRALVIGLGLSGRSAAEFLWAHGVCVQGVDRDAQLLATHPAIQSLKQKGVHVHLETIPLEISSFDWMILSPGIPDTHFLVQKAQKRGIPVLGEIELGCFFVKNPLLGITGTNGKTTVAFLVAHVLKECGQEARVLGNIGIPLAQNLLHLSPEEKVVLELSSYQLERLQQPVLETALLLNITPDHLDRYGTLEKYAAAKCKIESCLKQSAHLYMEEKAWENYGFLLKEKRARLYGYSENSFVYTDLQGVFREGHYSFELPLSLKNKKSHELENLLAAYTLCADCGVTGEAFIHAWKTFKKPAHRIEFVGEYQGVKYYDDSKGTNIDAVLRAVDSLEGSLILIAGGVDKGAPYTSWLEGFKNKVKSICAIGQAAAKIQAQLSPSIPVTIFNSLEEAVRKAAQEAQEGDCVLLSPGCASLDMFRDYAQRGEEFQRIVHQLQMKEQLLSEEGIK